MSQQLQSAPNATDTPTPAPTPQADDPLAELARIVAGGEILPAQQTEPQQVAKPQDVVPGPVEHSDDVLMEDLEAALARDLEVVNEAPAEVAAPLEMAAPIQERVVQPEPVDEIMDLESQLMAELGGSDPVVEEPQYVQAEPTEEIAPAPIAEPVAMEAPVDQAEPVVEHNVAAVPLSEPMEPTAGPEEIATAEPVVPEAIADAPETLVEGETRQTTIEPVEAPKSENTIATNNEPPADPVVDLDFGAAFDAQVSQDPQMAETNLATPQQTVAPVEIENPFGDNPFAQQEADPSEAVAPIEPMPALEPDPLAAAIDEQQQIVEQSASELMADEVAQGAEMAGQSDLEDAFADAFSTELEKQGHDDVELTNLFEPVPAAPVEVASAQAQTSQAAPVPEFLNNAPQTVAGEADKGEAFSIDEFENAFASELGIEETEVQIGEPSNQAHMFDETSAELGEAQPVVPPLAPVAAPEEIATNPSVEPHVAASQTSTPTGLRPALGALALALVAGAAIVGYGYLTTPASTSDEPELIKAEADDYKQKPEDPGGKEIANQDQPVYDALAGKTGDEQVQEKLVSDTQEPVKVARTVETTPVKSDERLNPGDDVSESANSPTTIMKPRRVKTVTVRPDGTLVLANNAGEDAVSNVGLAPMVPKAPTQEAAADTASIDGAVSTGKVAIPSANPKPLPKTVETALVEDKKESAAEQATRSLVTPKPVKVEAKPVVAKPVALSEPKPVEQPKPVVTTAATAGQYVVQISSQRSLEAAQATYQNLNRRFSSILSGRPVDIKEAKVEGKGTFYRVRVPIGSKQAAANFCGRYKGAGGSCFVTR